MQNKTVLFLVLFLVSVAAVSAEELYIDGDNYRVVYEIADNEINIEQEAKLTMVVTNDRPTIERFRIKELSGRWDLRTDPTSVKLSGQKLFPKSIGEEFEVYLQPDPILNVGRYEVTVNVGFEGDGENQNIIVPVYVEPLTEESKTYNPAVKIKADIPEEIDPRQEAVLKFTLDNLNKLNIEELNIDISSKLINEQVSTSLQPLEEGKVIEITKKLDPKLSPQGDTLVAVFSAGDKVLKTITKDFSIIDYTGVFKLDLEKRKSFLKTEGTLVYTNDGNTKKTDTVRVQISPFKKLFTTTYPQAKVIKDQGVTYYAWDLTLEPQESSGEIKIVTSFRWLFYLIAIIIVAAIAYFGFKNPLIVRKQGVKLLGRDELKIMINIKNPSNHTVHDLAVFDKVPNIAEVIHEFGLGTLSPAKILRSEKDGSTLLKWNVDKLEPYEDRIISYKVRPRLRIVGDFSLPSSTVKYKKDDKLIRISSNAAVITTAEKGQ